jgi:hypothetical protein
VRGSELRVVKFQNTHMTRRNFFVPNGNGFYLTEYHTRAKASPNCSFYVARYLPERVTEVTSLYLMYIRPFAGMLYRHGKKNVRRDVGYLFCSDRSPDKCWTGDVLSDVLQKESLARLKVKLNLWSGRHILIAITKVHVKDIAGHFAKYNRAWRDMLMQNPDFNIFAWQVGHQRQTNVTVYGLDAGRPQPELLDWYMHISRLWQR